MSSPPPFSTMTTLRLGGPPRRLVEARDEAELVAAVRGADEAGEPLLVIAGGSNLVVADAGYDGTAVRVATRGVAHSRMADGRIRLEVQAGEDWDALVAECVAGGLAGVEALSGIPGSVGATPIQNVGAYGQEVADVISSVRVLYRPDGEIVELDAVDCEFDYRSSRFKREPGWWVVLGVTLALEPTSQSAPLRYGELSRRLRVHEGAGADIAAVREAVLELRRGKGMVLDRSDPDSVSAGSFFTNPVLRTADFEALRGRVRERLGDDAQPPAWPESGRATKTSAAWLIERAGFARGHGNGRGVAISSKHTLALTNRGDGSTAALIDLAREIAAGVEAAFGVKLVPEPVLVGVDWDA